MRRGTLATLLALPDFLPLAVIVLAHGAAMASAMPYITLFATQEAGMDPLRLGVFMTTIALSGIAMSAAFGRAFDRRDSRRPIVLATLVLAAAAYVALAFARDYRLLLAIAALLLGAPAAAFPQVFALAKERLDGHAERGITALRSVFSLAWVFGPPAGALLLARADFQGLYLTTAALLLLAAAPLARLRPAATVARAAPPGGNILEADAPSRPVVPVALAFAVYGMANSMAAIALPLHVTLNLGGSRADVGLLVALGALLEIPFMLAIALYPGRLPAEGLIILAFALFGAYALGAALAPGLLALAAVQGVRAVVIAITATLGMTYFHSLMPGRVGSATALFMNTTAAGQVLAGVAAGAFAQALGFQAVFYLCAAITAAACLLLLRVSRLAPANPVVEAPATSS